MTEAFLLQDSSLLSAAQISIATPEMMILNENSHLSKSPSGIGADSSEHHDSGMQLNDISSKPA
jgi:hypothetical protein